MIRLTVMEPVIKVPNWMKEKLHSLQFLRYETLRVCYIARECERERMRRPEWAQTAHDTLDTTDMEIDRIQNEIIKIQNAINN